MDEELLVNDHQDVHMEQQDESLEPLVESVNTTELFANLAETLDTSTILSIVGNKVFGHYTVWDLILAKARLSSESGTLRTIVGDIAIVLCELKMLVESCLKPVRQGKVAVRKKTHEVIEFDDMLTMAMGMDTNTWLKKDPDHIYYKHPFLELSQLFPARRKDVLNLGKVEIQQKVIEEPVSEVEGDEDDDSGREKENIQEEEEEEDEQQQEGKEEKLVEKKRVMRKRVVTRIVKKRRKRRTKAEMAKVEKKGEFDCVKCGKNYSNFSAWYKHMENVCASRASLRISIRTVGTKYFCAFKGCSISKHSFATKNDVHDHWALTHVSEDQKIIPCLQCSLKFATIGARKIHMAKVHVKDNPLAAKKRVRSTGPRKQKAPREEDENEEENQLKEKYLCLKCGQSMNKESGKKHEEKCTGVYVRRPEYKKVDDEYFCTVAGCTLGYGFNAMYGLRKHFHSVHTREEEKFFSCDYCDEKFSFRTTCNKHVAEKHLKSHVCDLCGKGFGGRSKMLQHRFLHTGEKPFSCPKCDYRAAKRCNLEAHMESKHNILTQKNFICAVCNKQFVSMGRVRRHMNNLHSEQNEEGKNTKKKRKVTTKTAVVQSQSEIIMHQPEHILVQEKPQEMVTIPIEQTATTEFITSTIPQHLVQTTAVNEQDAAVQYLKSELGNENETVITVQQMF